MLYFDDKWGLHKQEFLNTKEGWFSELSIVFGSQSPIYYWQSCISDLDIVVVMFFSYHFELAGLQVGSVVKEHKSQIIFTRIAQ